MKQKSPASLAHTIAMIDLGGSLRRPGSPALADDPDKTAPVGVHRRETQSQQQGAALDDSLVLEGVIHRINNPLASLLLSLTRLTEQLTGGEANAEVRKMALEARADGERLAGAVRELRALSPRDQPRRVDAQGVLGTVLSTLELEEPQLVVRRRFASVLPVFVREVRFAQVFRGVGRLLIEAERAHSGAGEVELLVEAQEYEDQLRVTLTCARSTMELHPGNRSFASRLAILRGMVQQLGGALTVCANGLKLALPVRAPVYDSELEVDLTRRLSAPPRGEMRILVVDDELAMHRALTRGLGELGVVQAVRSMSSAIELVEGGATFDVILTDLIMPGGTGLELSDWLAAHRPKLRKRMILMTAMADTHADSHPDVVVVSKPFDLPALRELVCQVAGRA